MLKSVDAPLETGGVNSLPFLEGVNPFCGVHLKLARNSRERIPKVYKNLEKVGLKVETLKKSLFLSLVVETTRKKSQSRSRN